MKSKFEEFKKLHNRSELFVLPNAWNAASAILLQEGSYLAIGTSSAAVATTLGYPDGEHMPFSEYLMIIRRICASVTVPVTIDMEMGYGKTPEAIYDNLQQLIDAGVVGINLEDSVMTKEKRSLKDCNEFVRMLTVIKKKLDDAHQSLFLNVRCDTYLLNVNNKEKETEVRLKAYESAGADGIFLPFINEAHEIEHAISKTKLPLNVMVVPDLPGVDKLNNLGVKRVSMGPFLQTKTYERANELAIRVAKSNNFKLIL